MSGTAAGPRQPGRALIAEATKRAGLIWITAGGSARARPAWHVWLDAGDGAAAYVLTGPGEQPLPELAGAARATVTVPGKDSGGLLMSWPAAVGRVEPGSREWAAVIGPLLAGRLNAATAPGEDPPARRWARAGTVYRLGPAE
jgi:hypothetical protein